MKILNLFAGIGGNRRLWGDDHEIIAIEKDERIAEVYKRFYSNDIVIIADVLDWLNSAVNHMNLLTFDFIWASPPCTTHTGMPRLERHFQRYVPDLTSLFGIMYFFDIFKYYGGEHIRYVIENVRTWYTPPRPAEVKLGRHHFWSNFRIPHKEFKLHYKDDDKEYRTLGGKDILKYYNHPNFAWQKGDWMKKRQVIRNMVDPDIGKYILELATITKKRIMRRDNKELASFLDN